MWAIETRKDLTAEWHMVVLKKLEYAILTYEISKSSFGLTTKQRIKK
ncbi:hypothetical protein [Methanobrevibacter gottschalkii]|nr:hypothetical protein [Methanobrevibacter gottschalkii]